MKKIIFALVAGLVLSAGVPVFAEETAKDECLLASKDCMNAVDSLQQKVRKLNAEISKGTKVYSANEIKKLEAKLKEVETVIEQLETN
jgi:uncharacterized protein YlxW (UPF0749 family)